MPKRGRTIRIIFTSPLSLLSRLKRSTSTSSDFSRRASLPISLVDNLPLAASYRLCTICCKARLQQCFPSKDQLSTLGCDHKLDSICYGCLSAYADTQALKSSSDKVIPCIHGDCTGSIPLQDLRYQSAEALGTARKPLDPVAANEAFLRKYTKPCPKCKTPLMKGPGCSAVTCARPTGCGYQFCWHCTANWKPVTWDASKHHPGCKLYSRSAHRHSVI